MNWKLGNSNNINEMPTEWREAYVPSDVQLIFGEVDTFYSDNYKKLEWMENKFWFYVTELFIEDCSKTPVLCFKGLDYRYTIFIDDEVVANNEGMFTPVEIDLSSHIGETIIVKVVLHPAPKKAGAPKGRVEASACCKPAVSYGWDWHPRLIPIGIYDEVFVEYRDPIYITDIDYFYRLSDSFDSVTGSIIIKIDKKSSIGSNITAELSIHDELVFFQKKEAEDDEIIFGFVIENPKLWWCVSQGDPNLYKLTVKNIIEGKVFQEINKNIGFRKARLVMNEGGWEGASFPKTQGKAPMTIELNGRRIFAKGTNFVPQEMFTSLLNKDVYEPMLNLVKECNMNIVRMWGGGLVNKDSFFSLCDEMGILVWQEFPLACNNYEDDTHYLKVLDKESRSIIKRVKKHPCLVMWSGGNELLCSWSGMTNQSLALRLLNKNCLELDPHTPFIMTSPLYGVGHGHYFLLDNSETEAMSLVVNSDFTGYCEFGVPSPSPFEYIKSFTPEEEWYDTDNGVSWAAHHARGGWDGQKHTWFCDDQIEGYYGKSDRLEDTIEQGLILQSEIYKNIYEESRRKWPYTSMALNWCFNDCWPTAANNSIVMYPINPKPSYYGVKTALRNQMMSLRFEKMRWNVGEIVEVEVFALNDLPSEMKGVNFKVVIKDLKGNVVDEIIEGLSEKTSFNSCERKAVFKYKFNKSGKYKLAILCDDNSFDSEYLIFVKN